MLESGKLQLVHAYLCILFMYFAGILFTQDVHAVAIIVMVMMVMDMGIMIIKFTGYVIVM